MELNALVVVAGGLVLLGLTLVGGAAMISAMRAGPRGEPPAGP